MLRVHILLFLDDSARGPVTECYWNLKIKNVLFYAAVSPCLTEVMKKTCFQGFDGNKGGRGENQLKKYLI